MKHLHRTCLVLPVLRFNKRGSLHDYYADRRSRQHCSNSAWLLPCMVTAYAGETRSARTTSAFLPDQENMKGKEGKKEGEKE